MKYFSPGLLDGSVITAKLADGAVTTVKLAVDAVTSAKLANIAVGSEHLQGSSVQQAKIAGNAIIRAKIATSETSLAGTIPTNGNIDLTLGPYTFWPMIHVSDQDKIGVTGHITDAPGSDNARLALNNNSAGVEDFDLDYRSID